MVQNSCWNSCNYISFSRQEVGNKGGEKKVQLLDESAFFKKPSWKLHPASYSCIIFTNSGGKRGLEIFLLLVALAPEIKLRFFP